MSYRIEFESDDDGLASTSKCFLSLFAFWESFAFTKNPNKKWAEKETMSYQKKKTEKILVENELCSFLWSAKLVS